MESTLRNIIIIGVVVVLLAGIGLFVVNRTGLRNRIATNTTDTQPLGETPLPTTIAFPSVTPFPYLGIITGTATPSVSPRPSQSPSSALGGLLRSASPSPSASAAPQISCNMLGATPTKGSSPLTVKFTAKGNATNGANREYEFTFGDGDSLRQAGTTASHTYNTAGNWVASLKVRDSQGNAVDLGVDSCQQSITVNARPQATSAGNTSSLPSTGPESFWLLLIAPLTALGVYLYKRFRLL